MLRAPHARLRWLPPRLHSFEGRIVQAMIRADGGTGVFTELTPPMLGIWDTLVAGKADATWVSGACAVL